MAYIGEKNLNDPFFQNNVEKGDLNPISFNNIGAGYTSYEFQIPNFCAFEGKPSFFKIVYEPHNAEKFSNNEYRTFLTFQCQHCYKYISIGYKINLNSGTAEVLPYDYNFSLVNLKFPFDDNIKDNFQNFYSIYMQTIKAEKLGFDKIVGMGYRKALENIVKQYLIDNPPIDDSSNNSFDPINSSLYKCIEKLDPELIKTAHISRLVGNDETHFDSSKNSELTLKDQKKSLFIVVKRIEMKLQEAEFDDKYDQTQNN